MGMFTPPYMMTVKNLAAIMSKIKSAGTPPKFTVEFLKTTLGFTSSSDRGVIPQLKLLKMITEDGTPTERYNLYRGKDNGKVLAMAIKEGYAEVFMADQQADKKSDKELRDMFTSLSGKGDAVAQKMATTFKGLCLLADFSGTYDTPEDLGNAADNPIEEEKKPRPQGELDASKGISLNLRHDVHVHLPATSDVAVYKAIFRAINDELTD